MNFCCLNKLVKTVATHFAGFSQSNWNTRFMH